MYGEIEVKQEVKFSLNVYDLKVDYLIDALREKYNNAFQKEKTEIETALNQILKQSGHAKP